MFVWLTFMGVRRTYSYFYAESRERHESVEPVQVAPLALQLFCNRFRTRLILYFNWSFLLSLLSSLPCLKHHRVKRAAMIWRRSSHSARQRERWIAGCA